MTDPIPSITLFSTCKPFRGEIAAMQHNALSSWQRLNIPILLFGDEPGVKEAAKNIGARHIPVIERTPAGYPLVSALFSAARRLSETEYLAYSNADIILMPDFLQALNAALQNPPVPKPIFLTARRQHIPLSQPLTEQQFEDDTLPALVRRYGCWDKANAMDIFVFHRDLFKDLPPLAVGRMQWDNWLLWKAKQEGAMVIDATAAITVLHPIHGYATITGDWQQFTQDDDARNNRKLCAGRLLMLDQAATYKLVASKLVEYSTKIPNNFEPDRKKLLAGGLVYLREGFEKRSLAETIDCIRNLLWNNETYFPLNSTAASFTHAAVYYHLQQAEIALNQAQLQDCLNILQDLLVAPFMQQIDKKRKQKRSMYIWGCGQLGQRLQTLLYRKGLDFQGFLDSDQKQHDKIINGKLVISDQWRNIKSSSGKNPFIIIASMYYREIAESLQTNGLLPTQDFIA